MKDEEMADKHAEEYRKNFRYYRAWHGQVVDKSPSTIVEQSFKDGFLAGLKAGRPQWHYVKDGDYPKDETEKEYLVALKSEYSGFHYEIDIWCKSLHCFASNNPIKVYAWKEIVLPKESE